MNSLRPSLSVSILAFLSCLLLATWLLFSLFALRTAENDLVAQKAQHARMLLATFINQLPESLPVFPEGILQIDTPAAIYARNLAENPDFIRLTLLDRAGKSIFSVGREGTELYAPFSPLPVEGGSSLTQDSAAIAVATPVRGGAAAGKAGLLISLAEERARLSRSRQLYMAYFALDFILLLGLGSLVLSRIVVSPVNRLLLATERIIDGHYGQRVRISGSLELARLAESFNHMSERLRLKDEQVATQMAALEQANRELRQAREETLRSEKMASIGLLAAGMAHEIGTPLASIMGFAELLEEDSGVPETLRDYARRISQDCSRIDRIVAGLLDYSRPRISDIQTVDPNAVLLDPLELLTQQGALKGIRVETRFDREVPPVLADPHQLQQVLINLLLNSRDAVGDGGRIGIRVRRSNPADAAEAGFVALDVLDNGCGIAEEDLRKIFDPFFTTKAPGKGTGLGLAISARIVESFGGRIIVKSRPGSGSCFTLLLPAAPAEGADP